MSLLYYLLTVYSEIVLVLLPLAFFTVKLIVTFLLHCIYVQDSEMLNGFRTQSSSSMKLDIAAFVNKLYIQ